MIPPNQDFDAVDLLAEVCSMLSIKPSASAPKDDISDYSDRISLLQWRMRVAAKKSKNVNDVANTPMAVELFQIALSVYLRRGTEDLLDKQSKQLLKGIDRAFALMSQLPSCERQFPLLILGIEAQSDEQRITFIDLLSRSKTIPSPNPLDKVRGVVEAIWAQHDLADNQLDYMKLLRGAISPAATLPAFI
jgi:hypothetical protein